MPALPFLSDSEKEVETIVKSSEKYGADYILYGGLTLYGDALDDCKTLYFNFLKESHPDLVDEYENLFKGSTSLSKRYQNDFLLDLVKYLIDMVLKIV
jgi:DNA repair photolyase